VLQKSLDDFTVKYEVNVYTASPEHMEQIYSRLHMNIQDRFNEAGIEIMSPSYAALRDGNRVTIPGLYDSTSTAAPVPYHAAMTGGEPGLSAAEMQRENRPR
jgi:small-conductance mechanosensitive channel